MEFDTLHRSQWLTHADRFVLIGSCAESGDDDADNDGAIVTNYRAVVAWTGVLRFRSTKHPVHQDNNHNHNHNHNQNHKNNIDDSGGDHHTEKYRSNPFFVWYPNETPTVVSKTFLSHSHCSDSRLIGIHTIHGFFIGFWV